MTTRPVCFCFVLLTFGYVAPSAWTQDPSVERQMKLFRVRGIEESRLLRESPFPAVPRLRQDARRYYPKLLRGDQPISFEEDFGDGAQPNFVALITELIAEDSWSNSRNRITVTSGQLLVVQTPPVVERIGRFLRLLERRAQRQFRLEVALVPPAALGERDSPWIENEAFEAVLRRAGDDLVTISGLIHDGDTDVLWSGGAKQRVLDLEVNQTGVVPVLNSVVSTTPVGFFARSRLSPGPNPEYCRLDIEVARAALARKPEQREVAGTQVDLIEPRGTYIGTTTMVRLGAPLLLGTFDAERVAGEKDEPDGPHKRFAAIVRVSRIGAEVDESLGPGLPRAVEIGAIVHDLPKYRASSGRSSDESIDFAIEVDEGDGGFASEDFLVSFARNVLPKELQGKNLIRPHDSAIYVAGDAANATRIRDGLELFLSDRARLCDVELWQIALDRSEQLKLGAAGAKLVKNWRDGVEFDLENYCRVVGLAGQGLAVSSVDARSGVRDVEVVSGGTGQRILVVGDPILSTIGGGVELSVESSLVPGTDWAQLQIEGEAARPPVTKRKATVRANQDVELVEEDEERGQTEKSDGKADGIPGIEAVGSKIDIDLTDEDTDSWRHLVTVQLGQSIVLNVFPDRAKPGRTRMVIARVRAYGQDGRADREF